MDYEAIEKALSEMKPRQQLYEIVKKEMIKRDRWKYRKRGASFKKGEDKRRGKL